MKFIDELVIKVESGKGGDGMISFRREKYVPYGGPSGGDGGRGGDIILEACEGLNTLYEVSFRRVQKGENGGKGKAKDMAGADAPHTVIPVPVGTIVYDNDSGEILADLDKNQFRFIAAKGGKGGRGNARFASSVRRAPRIAEKGEPGELRQLRLELKLLADVGLVGLPNAGKSTLLSVITNSKPKIADYPFTTLVPNLGIVKPEGMPSFCVADLPGLIEGAHLGAGLGIQFLKHIERTRVLVHLVDLSIGDSKKAVKDFETVMEELVSFNPDLGKKPMLIAATKMDLPSAKENLTKFGNSMKKKGFLIFPISGVTKSGLEEVLKAVAKLLGKSAPRSFKPEETFKTYSYLPSFEIEKSGQSTWEVHGTEIERLVNMTDFTSDESIAIFKQKLKKIGFLDELEKCRGEQDDTVSIGEMDFYFREFFG